MVSWYRRDCKWLELVAGSDGDLKRLPQLRVADVLVELEQFWRRSGTTEPSRRLLPLEEIAHMFPRRKGRSPTRGDYRSPAEKGER